MTLSTNSQFGLIVAYLLPGFIGLAGLAPFMPMVSMWLLPGDYAQASLGPPVYALLAATTLGMVASCIRWLIIDHLQQWSGLTAPEWDDANLEQRLSAFSYLVDNHYRYYQFTANALVALAAAYGLNRFYHTTPLLGLPTDISVVLLCAALFAGSRDNLRKYYARTSRLIGSISQSRKDTTSMTNGNDHGSGASSPSSPKQQPKERPKDEKAKPSQSPRK